jgi:hypothetical protein
MQFTNERKVDGGLFSPASAALSGSWNAERWSNSSSREKIFRSCAAVNNLAQISVGPYQQGLRFEAPVGNGILP